MDEFKFSCSPLVYAYPYKEMGWNGRCRTVLHKQRWASNATFWPAEGEAGRGGAAASFMVQILLSSVYKNQSKDAEWGSVNERVAEWVVWHNELNYIVVLHPKMG